MKNVIKTTTIALAFTFLSTMVVSAQEHNMGNMHKGDDTTHKMDMKKIDKNNDGVVYQCPMKCEVSDKPGECSKCGMTLKEVSLKDISKDMKYEGKGKRCCSDKEGMKKKNEMMEKHGEKMGHSKTINHDKIMDHDKMEKHHDKMGSSIVREGTIDVASIDHNGDGKVFQDAMDWNVISDEAGKCPLCGMILKEVTVDQAIKNLNKNGFKTK